MLNEKLNLNECLELLNKMAKETIDVDATGEELIYILVDLNQMENLKKLIPNENDFKKYLDDFGENFEEEGFDITGILGEICFRSQTDIWFDNKNKKFYIN